MGQFWPQLWVIWALGVSYDIFLIPAPKSSIRWVIWDTFFLTNFKLFFVMFHGRNLALPGIYHANSGINYQPQLVQVASTIYVRFTITGKLSSPWMWFQLTSLYLDPSPKKKQKSTPTAGHCQVNSFPGILASAISTRRRRIMLQGSLRTHASCTRFEWSEREVSKIPKYNRELQGGFLRSL